MNKKCSECEKDILLELADLSMEYDKSQAYLRLTEKALDTAQALNSALRTDNEELRNKLKVYRGR